MRALAACLPLLFLPSAAPADELDAIAWTAFDYVAGTHTGDATRLKRALHAGMTGRRLHSSAEGNRLRRDGACRLVRKARGKKTGLPPGPGVELIVLDVHGDLASVMAMAYGTTEYLHLARLDGRWLVVDALGVGEGKKQSE